MNPEKRKYDFYSKLAKEEGLIARSAYKLKQINQKFNIIKNKDIVVDLGAAPGAWSKVTSKIVGENGFVLGIDLLPVAHSEQSNLMFIRGDLLKKRTISDVEDILKEKQANVVLSDMSPDFTGIRRHDIGKAMVLSEMAFEFAKQFLKKNGNFACKVFQGPDYENFLKDLRANFETVKTFKPKASRKESSEMYVVCKGFKKEISQE